MRCSASYFNLQYLLLSLTSSSRWLRLPPRLADNDVFWQAVPTQDITIPVRLPPFTLCRISLFCSTLCSTSFSLYCSNWSSPSFSNKTCQNFPLFFSYFPNFSSVFITYNLSRNLSKYFQQCAQYRTDKSKILTQSFHIPTRFGGGHYRQQEIHLVS